MEVVPSVCLPRSPSRSETALHYLIQDLCLSTCATAARPSIPLINLMPLYLLHIFVSDFRFLYSSVQQVPSALRQLATRSVGLKLPTQDLKQPREGLQAG